MILITSMAVYPARCPFRLVYMYSVHSIWSVATTVFSGYDTMLSIMYLFARGFYSYSFEIEYAPIMIVFFFFFFLLLFANFPRKFHFAEIYESVDCFRVICIYSWKLMSCRMQKRTTKRTLRSSFCLLLSSMVQGTSFIIFIRENENISSEVRGARREARGAWSVHHEKDKNKRENTWQYILTVNNVQKQQQQKCTFHPANDSDAVEFCTAKMNGRDRNV